MSEAAPAPNRWLQPEHALLVALATTVVVTIVSHVAPLDWANTAVGATFLGATWWVVLRGDTEKIRAHGLSLGGITEPEPIDVRRMAAATAKSLAWATLLALIFFPPFWIAYKLAWTQSVFTWRAPQDFSSRALGQLLVVGLPEEAFFRGFLQSSLDGSWKDKRWRVLGAEIGPGWVLSAVIFAVGHVLTIPNPARLGVFFPALIFGWLRARTGGVGASIVFHAMCNLFSAYLAQGYGLLGG